MCHICQLVTLGHPGLTFILILSPPSLRQHGVPRTRAPRQIICNSLLFRNFQADILALREQMKDLQLQASISELREFVTVGKAGFLALRGERVKFLTLGYSGTQPWVPECLNVRNFECTLCPKKNYHIFIFQITLSTINRFLWFLVC